MLSSMDKLMEAGCSSDKKDRVCRSRGGESCAFDGAMIVLQPIADTVHIVHGPIACCGNSWEGRGTLSSQGNFFRMGFTTDMNEMDIVYGAGNKLYGAIKQAHQELKPKAIFVHATCVSGLIGEDIDAVCRGAEKKLAIPVIPVNAPGFVGPKNLGNRIAGEVLLDYVIGTGEPSFITDRDINLIGEYNIAGDLWLIEPVLKRAGIRVLSRVSGDATFEEITYAHRAKLNVLVCSRALINVAKEMERKYGIPYIEVSFFGKTEMSKALRLIGAKLGITDEAEKVILGEEDRLHERLRPYEHLRGKKAVLYTGGVKSWSFISTLLDLGIEVVAVGTKKSTSHDEEKIKEIMGEDAPLVEDVAPGNLRKLLKERNADMLIAGGRNQYLAVKEGYPFVDVNQERHVAYAGYDGLLNFAQQISDGMRFYAKGEVQRTECTGPHVQRVVRDAKRNVLIDPLKHSQSIGAAIALQGIHQALPIIHGAQGCSFLGKALITKHFREPIALASTKLFAEDVVMGGDENLRKITEGFIEKNHPDVIAILTSGLSEVKDDELVSVIKDLNSQHPDSKVIQISTPDYEGGLETGYVRAVEALITLCDAEKVHLRTKGRINVLAGPHLTPTDFTELREIIQSFGLVPVMLPDLAALDGSRQGISPLAAGGTTTDEIRSMGASEFTIAIGLSMEKPAKLLKEKFDIEYRVLESIAGLKDTDVLMETLSVLSGSSVCKKYERHRRILIDGMRDAHFYYGNKRVCIALDPDLGLQTARWLDEMGAIVDTVVVPHRSSAEEKIPAEKMIIGDLFALEGEFDLLLSNSHAEDTAKRLGIPLYQMGFPIHKVLGNNSKITTGYRGTLLLINDIANLLTGSYEKVKVRKEVCS